MKITVFAKKKQTSEGKAFYTYLSTLKKKDGSEKVVQVRFTEEAGNPDPKKCPMNIEFEKASGNLSKREYTREDTGEIMEAHTLWIKRWSEGEPYVDSSLDDYE